MTEPGGDFATGCETVQQPLGWLVVTRWELRDLWLSGRGPIILVTYSVLLSLLTYLAATNKELNLLDQKGTVNFVVQLTIGLGAALSLLMSADAISGERERGTLEALLLTPVSRRQLAFGKLISALSSWPAIMLVSVPYIWSLRVGVGLFSDATLACFVVGGILAATFACLGIVVSAFSSSNRLSIATSFFVFIALLTPTQLPLSGWFGDMVLRVNPMTSGSHFLDRLIMNGHSWSQEASFLISPILGLVVMSLLASFVTGRIRIDGGFAE